MELARDRALTHYLGGKLDSTYGVEMELARDRALTRLAFIVVIPTFKGRNGVSPRQGIDT